MFDLLKGYAMIMIIVAHTFGAVPLDTMIGEHPSWISTFFGILLFHLMCPYGLMPLFFIISGYGFSATSMKRCVKSQTRTLMKPYLLTALFTTVVFYFSQCAYYGDWKRAIIAPGRVALSYLLGIPDRTVMFGISLYPVGTVWFILTLYLSWILLNAIMRHIPERYRPIVVAALVCIGYVTGTIARNHSTVIPFCLPQSFIGLGYVYVGHLMKKHNCMFQKLPGWVWFALLLSAFVTNIWGSVSMNTSLWKLGLIDLWGAGCLGYLVIRLFLQLNRYSNKFLDLIRKIGRYSLWIVCIHTVESQGLFWGVFARNFGEHFQIAFFTMLVLHTCLILAGFKVVSLCNRLLVKRKHRLKHL